MATPSHVVALGLAAAALVGLAIGWGQLIALARHLCGPRAVPVRRPPISILKPLCGLDDRLAANLRTFAALPYPDYEVLLGLRHAGDPAYPLARAAAHRWPGRFRVVLQEEETGLNPKVNQLMTLARHARHDYLVISDSNTRVPPGYLDEIAASLEDPRVGLVTHPLVGRGEARSAGRLGSAADNLHLSGVITPSIVTAKLVFGKDYVVGKSMAMRRADVEALGGFASVKDVLAEDFVLGRAVTERLHKRIVLGRTAVTCISERRSLGGFVRRYARWSVMQHQCAGHLAYCGLLLLNPVLLATAAVLADPSRSTAAVCALATASRVASDAVAGRLLRGRGFPLRALLIGPLGDLLSGAAWAHGLFSRSIEWRSNRLTVLRGSRLRVRPQRSSRTRPKPDTGPASAAA
jgi:ceramide glucosyltransferase